MEEYKFRTAWNICSVQKYAVELYLSGLIGTASHPDKHKILIIGFFFENLLHWQFETEKSLQTAILGYIFIYWQIKH
jgi:hypothetical protein